MLPSFLTGDSFTVTVPFLGAGLDLGLSLNLITAVLATVVLLIGAIVYRYSWRVLEGDSTRVVFLNQLAHVQSYILLMLMSPSLAQFVLFWILGGQVVRKLLIHFSNRTRARKVHAQYRLIFAIADIFLVLGVALLQLHIGLPNFTMLSSLGVGELSLDQLWYGQVGIVLVVVGILAKSAQFPVHYWLPNSMEAPTPVSAFLHAGFVNAGGVLVLKLSPLLVMFPLSLDLLFLVGIVTVVFGAAVSVTQSDVKQQLAYSTVAQMGFMFVQFGCGAFGLAFLHLIGHALYKSYALLSNGTAVEVSFISRFFREDTSSERNVLYAVLAVPLALLALSPTYILSDSEISPSFIVLFLVTGFAIAHAAVASRSVRTGLLFLGSFGAVAFVLHAAATSLFEAQGLPLTREFTAVSWVLSLSFIAVAVGVYTVLSFGLFGDERKRFDPLFVFFIISVHVKLHVWRHV